MGLHEAPASPRPIHLKGVSKHYSSTNGSGSLEVLQNIQLDIHPGEFVCIVGPSGCGKSTLLNIIAGLTPPDEGEACMGGTPIEGPGSERVLMFQEAALFPWLTVSQNIEFGLKVKGMAEAKRMALVSEYLQLVRLFRFKDSFVHELSGGMRQRVALARALAMHSEVLLMDEPFAALDAQTRDNLHRELQEIWQKTRKTIVFVTHNVSEAVALGDRVIVMTYRPGRIKKEFRIEYPRPRNYRSSPELAEIAGHVLDELKGEVEKAMGDALG